MSSSVYTIAKTFRRIRITPNVFEIARNLPDYGVGSKIKRHTWLGEDCFWTITKIKPNTDGRHGKAWGIKTWRGTELQERPTRIRGTLKQVWTTIAPAPFIACPPRKDPLATEEMGDSHPET
mmetsp:Transcript_11974/g.22706  ORF Transcript_11974/g.22706 Transcript_11974/m.22706 type:complete len:122 (+) Transcript_11974:54-419(+)